MAIGALVGLVTFLTWVYLGSGPGRYEWVDSAVVMVPSTLLGALVGAAIAPSAAARRGRRRPARTSAKAR